MQRYKITMKEFVTTEVIQSTEHTASHHTLWKAQTFFFCAILQYALITVRALGGATAGKARDAVCKHNGNSQGRVNRWVQRLVTLGHRFLLHYFFSVFLFR